MRRHGCHLPFHRLQVIASLSFVCLFISFYLFSAPFLGKQEVISTCTVLYTLLVIAVLGLYIRCAAINPEDKGISIHIPIQPFNNMDAITISQEKVDTIRDSILKLEALHSLAIQSHQQANKSTLSKLRRFLKFPFICISEADDCLQDEVTSSEAMSNSLNCVLCNRRVNTCSKHCKSCDKCVYGFDHHCKWINNCIGKKNYVTFLALMVATIGLLLLEVVAGMAVIVRCSIHAKGFNERIYEKLGSSFSKGLVVTIVAISSSISLVALAAIGELLLFHILLIKKGLTTYDYVVASRTLNELHSLSDYENTHSHLPVSPVSSFLSSRSVGSGTFGTYYRSTWCTPPRIYLDSDYQDEVAPQLPALSLPLTADPDSTSSTTSTTTDRRAKPQRYKVKISPWQLARLDMDEVARLVSKTRTSRLHQGQQSSPPVFGHAMSWPQRSSSNSNTNTCSYSSTNAIESSAKSSADGEEDDQHHHPVRLQSRSFEGMPMPWISSTQQSSQHPPQSLREFTLDHHQTQLLETRDMSILHKAANYRHSHNTSRVCPVPSKTSSMLDALRPTLGHLQQSNMRGVHNVPLMHQSRASQERNMQWSCLTDHSPQSSHYRKADFEMSPGHMDDELMESPRCVKVQSSSPGSASKALLTTTSINEEDTIIIPSKNKTYCRSLNFEQQSESLHVDGASIFFGGPLSCPSTPPSMLSDAD